MLAFAGRFVVTGHKPAQEARCASVMKYSAASGPISEMITEATLGPIPGIVIIRSRWRPKSGALERSPACCHGIVAREHAGITPALTGEVPQGHGYGHRLRR